MTKPKLIVINGPTAIGKTRFSTQLAKLLKTQIISSDSRQFYKEMSIGTAVPTSEERDNIEHYFIQHKSIHEKYSVGDFENEAIDKINSLFKKNNTLILVGGSNFFTYSVINGLDEFPKIADEITNFWKNSFKKYGISQLQKELKKYDFEYYKKVDLNNHVRLIRALSVCQAGNKKYSQYLGSKSKKRLFETIQIELILPRELLYKKINDRVDEMIKKGLINEVKSLIKFKNLNPLKSVGYKEIFEYLEGKINLDESVELIKRNTRRLAKKQITWLRNHPSDYKINAYTTIDNSFLKIIGIEKGT